MVGVVIGLVIGFSIAAKVVKENKTITETFSPTVQYAPSETESVIEQTVSPIQTSTPIEVFVPTYYDCPLDDDLQDYIREQCTRYDLPMVLVIALIAKESSFRPNVISGSNDYGLMQINTIKHQWLSEQYGITDFLDPYQNVRCGIIILGQHYQKYGDVNKALMAYNLGATGAKRQWDKGIYSNGYTEKVQEYITQYENNWR